mgnify:CR=1 FL=1
MLCSTLTMLWCICVAVDASSAQWCSVFRMYECAEKNTTSISYQIRIQTQTKNKTSQIANVITEYTKTNLAKSWPERFLKLSSLAATYKMYAGIKTAIMAKLAELATYPLRIIRNEINRVKVQSVIAEKNGASSSSAGFLAGGGLGTNAANCGTGSGTVTVVLHPVQRTFRPDRESAARRDFPHNAQSNRMSLLIGSD